MSAWLTMHSGGIVDSHMRIFHAMINSALMYIHLPNIFCVIL